jgi:hypothetical protein
MVPEDILGGGDHLLQREAALRFFARCPTNADSERSISRQRLCLRGGGCHITGHHQEPVVLMGNG